jgi:hypothetical protein
MSSGVTEFPATLPSGTVVGRVALGSGPAEAVPLAALSSAFGIQNILVGSIAGTNAITGTSVVPTPALPLAVNQVVFFIPIAINTGPATFNRDALGVKNILQGGAALVGGELKIGVPVLLFYDGTQYNLIGIPTPLSPPLTNSLGADVALNNTANYFDGPSVVQGTVGTWFVSGSVIVNDAGQATIFAKLWDGTTVISSGVATVTGTNVQETIALSGLITAPAGNLRISCKDATTVNGKISFNNSGNSKDSTITAIRIA